MKPPDTISRHGTSLLCDRDSIRRLHENTALCEAFHSAIRWELFFLLPRDGMETSAHEMNQETAPRRLCDHGEGQASEWQHESSAMDTSLTPVRTPLDRSVRSNPPDDEPEGAQVIPWDHLHRQTLRPKNPSNRWMSALHHACRCHLHLDPDSQTPCVEQHR